MDTNPNIQFTKGTVPPTTKNDRTLSCGCHGFAPPMVRIPMTGEVVPFTLDLLFANDGLSLTKQAQQTLDARKGYYVIIKCDNPERTMNTTVTQGVAWMHAIDETGTLATLGPYKDEVIAESARGKIQRRIVKNGDDKTWLRTYVRDVGGYFWDKAT